MVHTDRKDGIFFYLLLLTGFFFLLEISFFIECNRTYLSDYTFVSDNLHIPVTILPGILYFIFAQLLIHVIYCILIWLMSLAIADLFNVSADKKFSLSIVIWLVGIITILVSNRYFFPNSKIAALTVDILFNVTITKIVFIFLLSLCGIGSILAGMGFCKIIFYWWRKQQKLNKVLSLGLVGSLFFLIFMHFLPHKMVIKDAATATHPNIIIVGVDSLRPDFLSYFGGEKSTPFFDTFLNHAAVFSEAVTPLARTFPSWSGILTGEYPRQMGIRFNLAQQDNVNLTTGLPAILQRNGYQTLYATDETRFSNIDKNYGFDRVITPPMGLNDFLIGTFNDFPLSNLLINTFVGQWLFPYSYANRPVFFTYDPNTFLTMLRPALEQQRTKPLFLAVHFCLPHSPYLWASLSGDDYNYLERYAASIVRVDAQLHDFFIMLQQVHLLDRSIVILLSDHGEALELPGDRITEKESFIMSKDKINPIPKFYPPSLDNEAINQSAGHGTDVLGLSQYHSLLAFKLYGLGQQHVGLVPGLVSLLDIKPTVLQLIGLHCKKPMQKNQCDISSQGESLARVITHPRAILPKHQPIFLESDYTPEAIRTVYPETRKVMLEGIQLFQIDPMTTRLTVKKSMAEMIINSKQYAVLDNHWILALYPQSKTNRIPILVNLESGQWTDDLHSLFAQHSPATSMLRALRSFYGKEINKV